MELPFLKNKKNQGGGGPAVIEHTPDSLTGDHMLRLIADELHTHMTKRNHAGALESLRAFVHHVHEAKE